MILSFFSPAKINLFFKLIGKREDGFHDLESFFQAISLGDKLTFRLSTQDHFLSNDKSLGFNESNFIIKALSLFRKKTQNFHPIEITLEKKIPIQAGLGGGSSNAATTLWALNQLLNERADLQTLFKWASQITSDSSFFFSKGTALCQGRGEIVQEMPTLPQQMGWLVKPSWGLSTKTVYLKAKQNSWIQETKEELLERLYSKNPLYLNDLQKPAFLLSPPLKELKDNLLQQGYQNVFMTGSGSGLVCFGKKKPQLEKSVQIFPFRYINRDPNHWYQVSEDFDGTF